MKTALFEVWEVELRVDKTGTTRTQLVIANGIAEAAELARSFVCDRIRSPCWPQVMAAKSLGVAPKQEDPHDP